MGQLNKGHQKLLQCIRIVEIINFFFLIFVAKRLIFFHETRQLIESRQQSSTIMTIEDSLSATISVIIIIKLTLSMDIIFQMSVKIYLEFYNGNQNKWCLKITLQSFPIRLYHPLDGITNPKYKLLCFLAKRRHQLLTRIVAAIQLSVYG